MYNIQQLMTHFKLCDAILISYSSGILLFLSLNRSDTVNSEMHEEGNWWAENQWYIPWLNQCGELPLRSLLDMYCIHSVDVTANFLYMICTYILLVEIIQCLSCSAISSFRLWSKAADWWSPEAGNIPSTGSIWQSEGYDCSMSRQWPITKTNCKVSGWSLR